MTLYFSGLLFLHENQFESICDFINVYKCVSSSSSKELAYVHSNEVIAADYDKHLYNFFSATTNEPTSLASTSTGDDK